MVAIEDTEKKSGLLWENNPFGREVMKNIGSLLFTDISFRVPKAVENSLRGLRSVWNMAMGVVSGDSLLAAMISSYEEEVLSLG